jgi:3-oxoacyl-(acyl-carrier-protein) synthase III
MVRPPIQPTPPQGHARLMGLGAYRPARVVSNDEVCAGLDVDDAWVRARSGIRSRRWAGPEESVVDMGAAAAVDALAAAGLEAGALDAVLVATMSQDSACPAVATRVGDRIGTTAPAMDLGAACAGFCYALEVAGAMVRAGTARHVLVVGVERMSDLLDLDDRTTAFIFGDGAGAVVVGPADDPGLGPVAWGADGSQADLIAQSPTWVEAARTPGGEFPGLRMQGPAVFRWATSHIAPVARKALDAAGIAPEQLDVFVPHQANDRITDGLARSLDLPDHVTVAHDVVEAGNTSAASVPLAMHALLDDGTASVGDLALLAGFGAGLTYAAQVVTLPAFH